jgi:hypothetical protein
LAALYRVVARGGERKGTKMRIQTYATEVGAKKAAARAYSPAIVPVC